MWTRSPGRMLLIFVMTVGPALPVLGQVFHGDYLDPRVDFLDVQETTQTIGDPPSLWGLISAAPSMPTERTLHSEPGSFAVSGGAGGDVKVSLLEVEIVSHLVHVIDEVLIEETILTSGSGAGTFNGNVTITADIAGPITPVIVAFVGIFVGSSGTASIDVAAAVPDATELDVDLINRVEAFGGGTSASKTSADITVFLPEPSGSLALRLGCLFVAMLPKRRPMHRGRRRSACLQNPVRICSPAAGPELGV